MNIDTTKLQYVGRIKINIEWESLYTDGEMYYIKKYNVPPQMKWTEIGADEIKNFHVVRN